MQRKGNRNEKGFWKKSVAIAAGEHYINGVKLPENTVIAPEKLLHYLLVPRPADDKSKFLAIAGYTRANWQALERDLRQQLLPMDAEEVERTKYGTVYEIRGNLQGPNGRVLSVVTIWMTEIATGQTKFVTLYPAKGAKHGRV